MGFFGIAIAANVQRIFLNSCLFHMQRFQGQRLHHIFFCGQNSVPHRRMKMANVSGNKVV